MADGSLATGLAGWDARRSTAMVVSMMDAAGEEPSDAVEHDGLENSWGYGTSAPA